MPRNFRLWLIGLAAIGLSLFLASCAQTYEGSYITKAQNKGYTEDEALVMLFSSYGPMLFEKTEDGAWEVDYSKVPVSWVENYTAALLADLDWILTCRPETSQNCSNWKRLTSAVPGFAEALMRAWDEAIWVDARARHVVLWAEFQEKMGRKTIETSSVTPYPPDYYAWEYEDQVLPPDPQAVNGSGTTTPDGGGGQIAQPAAKLSGDEVAYDIRMIYPLYDLEAEFAFVADYVERARAQGKLIPVDPFLVLNYQQYGEKETDTERNEIIWRSRSEGLEIRGYMIRENQAVPSDNTLQYIEIYRTSFEVNDEGRFTNLQYESEPALRGFMSFDSQKIDILVIDTDRENTAGWGTPDIVRDIVGISTAEDMYVQRRRDLRKWLFERAIEEAKRHEIYIPKHSQDLQIVYRGEVDVDIWEECPADGCAVPYIYADYTWRAEIAFTPKTEGAEIKQIQHFIKIFSSSARKVHEYYLPLADYSLENVREARGSLKSWHIWLVGKAKIEGGLEIFAQELPAMIEYTDPSDKKLIWQLVDEDGDGKFEKRREIIRE